MGKTLLKPSRAVSHRCVVCMCDGGRHVRIEFDQERFCIALLLPRNWADLA